MLKARLYLRASTREQDATRALVALETFAAEKGLDVVGTYAENESGTKLQRPELFRLLNDSKKDDVLLVEQVDRLSRLTAADWEKLKKMIEEKGVRVVSLDLPTSHKMTKEDDDLSGTILKHLNNMMLDVLAVVARKDYEDRRRRQAEGIAKAKQAGTYLGRPEDTKRNAGIERMLAAGTPWSAIMVTTRASRATVAKIARRMKEAASA